MLTPDEVQFIEKGWLVKSPKWCGVWVVDEREYDTIYVIPVNDKEFNGSRLTLSLDDDLTVIYLD